MKLDLPALIDQHQKTIIDEPRTYIGASSIGSDCWRKIWYEYKGTPSDNIEPKTRRTWDIGRILETLVIEWLTNAGINVEKMSDTFHAKNVPSLQGHIDGMLIIGKIKAILEIKTAKDASFKVFVNKGVKVWNPQYYAQLQAYMGMISENTLNRINNAYILVLNKDNSELSQEIVTFNQEFYLDLKNKAKVIASSIVPPPKINGSPLWYVCKLCKYNKVCHV